MPLSSSPDPSPGQARKAESYPSWRALTWFGLYRLALGIALLLFLYIPDLEKLAGGFEKNPWTVSISLSYLALVLLSLALSLWRLSDKDALVQTGVFLDILTFSLLMHHGGGVNSSFGLPMAIAVAAGALLMEGRLSLLFASFATIGVMAVQIHAQLSGLGPRDGFTQAGLLGATYFMVAILAHVLYRRIQAAERLAASRQVDIDDLSKLNAFIIQRMSTGVLVLDESRRIRLGNTATQELLGLQDWQGQPLAKAAPALAAWLAQQEAETLPPPTAATTLPALDLTLRIGERDIALSHLWLGHRPQGAVLLFLRDKRALLQEAQQIKLAALGRLTASIAHNIRNPLSAIKHASQLLAESPDLAEEDRHLLGIVTRNSGRIDGIVDSVLQLFRGQPPDFQTLDLASWLTDLHTELSESRRLPPERFQLDLGAPIPLVRVNADHLHQILSNLCDNALKHAGSEDQPPRLVLSAGPLSPSGADALSDRPQGTSPVGDGLGLRGPGGGGTPGSAHQVGRQQRAYPGAYIEVRDQGPPIDPEIAREMFTPFFTTSASGTGLGLYIALELAAINGITLNHLAPAEGGNCFRLTLPAAA